MKMVEIKDYLHCLALAGLCTLSFSLTNKFSKTFLSPQKRDTKIAQFQEYPVEYGRENIEKPKEISREPKKSKLIELTNLEKEKIKSFMNIINNFEGDSRHDVKFIYFQDSNEWHNLSFFTREGASDSGKDLYNLIKGESSVKTYLVIPSNLVKEEVGDTMRQLKEEYSSLSKEDFESTLFYLTEELNAHKLTPTEIRIKEIGLLSNVIYSNNPQGNYSYNILSERGLTIVNLSEKAKENIRNGRGILENLFHLEKQIGPLHTLKSPSFYDKMERRSKDTNVFSKGLLEMSFIPYEDLINE